MNSTTTGMHVLTTPGPRPNLEDAAWTDGETYLVVADGMGGHDNGAEAAAAVVELCRTSGFDFARVKAEAVSAVAAYAGRGSGTTLSLCTVDRDAKEIRWLHAGDSALWLVWLEEDEAPPTVLRLTADHSRFGALVTAGYDPSTISRYAKAQLDSCIYAPQRWSDDSGPPTWDQGRLLFPTDATVVYIFGTTDGFHEAFELDNGTVDAPRLAVEMLRLATMLQLGDTSDAASYLEGVAEKTQDNATLVWLRASPVSVR